MCALHSMGVYQTIFLSWTKFGLSPPTAGVVQEVLGLPPERHSVIWGFWNFTLPSIHLLKGLTAAEVTVMFGGLESLCFILSPFRCTFEISNVSFYHSLETRTFFKTHPVPMHGAARQVESPGVAAPERRRPQEWTTMTSTKPASKSTSNRTPQIDPSEFPKVSLTGNTWKIAKAIAALRTLVYENIDTGSVYGNQTSFDAHLTGSMGELAFAIYRDELHFEDISVIEHYGDPGWDFEVKDITYDVKCTGTPMRVPDLVIPESKDLNADIYVLTHRISTRSVRLIGWATKDEVTATTPRQDPGDTLNYIVSPRELHRFKS